MGARFRLKQTVAKQKSHIILLQILATALLYFGVGKLCLLWAIPPGFSTIIWLPSGIALFAVLSCGNFALIGVFLGSFSVNFFNPNFASNTQIFYIAVVVGAGATLQAFIGSVILKKYVNLQDCLRSDFEIIKFFIFAGPVSSLISPSIGCSALFGLGSFALSGLPVNFITWWIGDSLGAMIIAPFFFAVNAHTRQIRWSRFKILFWPVTGCFLLTLVFFYNARANEHAALKEQLRPQFETIISSFEKNIVRYRDLLHFSKILFTGTSYPTRTEFKEISLHFFESYPGLIGLSWIPIIPKNQRALWEKAARNEGFTDFEFQESVEKSARHKAPERDYYKIIFYNENVYSSNAPIGFNLFSEINRNRAMETANKSSTVSSTPIIPLVSSPTSGLGSVMYLAIKQGEMNHALLKENGQPIMAYVSLALITNKVIESAIGDFLNRDFNLTISESRSGSDNDKIVFNWGAGNPGNFRYEIERQVLGITQEPWFFSFAPTDTYILEHMSFLPRYLLIAGMLGTCAMFGFLLTMTGRNEAIETEIIERRTAEANLEQSNLELRHRKLELESAKFAAEEANRSKSAFLANMSHEIRTPLSAILGFSELLSMANIDIEKSSYRDTIKRNGKLLTTIINDILDISTIEVGKLSITIEETNLKELVADVDAMLRPEADRKGLKLEMTGDADLPVTISTDPHRLRQILINILGNAIKFTSSGSVTVRLRLVGSAKDILNISVDDNGPGIDPENSALLFRPFFQLDESLNRRYGGTGLGLALSRWLARYLGGNVFLEKSAPGQGSRFTIQINPKLKQDQVRTQIVDYKTEKFEPVPG